MISGKTRIKLPPLERGSSICCDRCGAHRYTQKLAPLDDLWVCVAIQDCHRRVMLPKLRLLPGGARY